MIASEHDQVGWLFLEAELQPANCKFLCHWIACYPANCGWTPANRGYTAEVDWIAHLVRAVAVENRDDKAEHCWSPNGCPPWDNDIPWGLRKILAASLHRWIGDRVMDDTLARQAECLPVNPCGLSMWYSQQFEDTRCLGDRDGQSVCNTSIVLHCLLSFTSLHCEVFDKNTLNEYRRKILLIVDWA